MNKRMERKSGFTMVEIIAVLVIIAIMAAVAAPKFVNMGAEARSKAAVAGINECMATLSVAYSKAYLENNGTEPDVGEVLTAAGFTSGTDVTFGDVVVTPTDDGAGGVDIATVSLKGTAIPAADVITEKWTKPIQ